MWLWVLVSATFLGLCTCASIAENSPKACFCPAINEDDEDNDELCECILYYQCDSTSHVNTDGAGIIDFKAKDGTGCGDGEICCIVPRTKPTVPESIDEPNEPMEPMEQMEPNEPKEPMEPMEPNEPKEPIEPMLGGSKILQCGETDFTSRLLGPKIKGSEDGIRTTAEEFPWNLKLTQTDGGTADKNIPDLYVLECTASLVFTDWALTTATCVHRLNHSKLYVRGGEWDSSDEESEWVETKKVTKVHIHNDFHEHIPLNDIALVQLEEPFEVNAYINTICLNIIPTSELNGKLCYATGWGTNDTVDGKEQFQLKKVRLPIVDRDNCEKNIKTAMLSRPKSKNAAKRWKLEKGFMCAGGEGDDTCSGDGGGPLMCEEVKGKDRRWIQVGITAWGLHPCGQKGVPGVYTDVQSHFQWIQDTIANNEGLA